MTKKSKKTILISFVLMIVFAAAAHSLANYQEKVKEELLHFIKYECGVQKPLVNNRGILTQDAIAAVRSELGDWRDNQKTALWDKFRYSDYWLSVSRTMAAVSLFIVFFILARAALSKIYIPKRIYGKFRQTEMTQETKEEENKPQY